MHTLVHLFQAAKTFEHLYLLEVIRAVVRERLPMPHAAVWWIIDSIRLGTEKNVDSAIASAKALGVGRHNLLDADGLLSAEGYLVAYYVRQGDGEFSEMEYVDFVIDDEYASATTEHYLSHHDTYRKILG